MLLCIARSGTALFKCCDYNNNNNDNNNGRKRNIIKENTEVLIVANK